MIEFPSEAEIYLEYVRRHRIENYEWITGSDLDSIWSELILEAPDRWLDRIIRDYWEWYSITGYIVPRRDVRVILDWPCRFRDADWKRRRAEELAVASIVFEDWADGTAMRLWSKAIDERTLLERMNLSGVNDALRLAGRRGRRSYD